MGALSCRVEKRHREIGIRMALGARREKILWMFLRYGLTLAFAGLFLGWPASWAAAQLARSGWPQVVPLPWLIPLVVSLLLLLVSLLATHLPARRATRVDPLWALRCE